MDEIAVHDIPFSEMESKIVAWVDEALELRHGAAGDPEGPLRNVLSSNDDVAIMLTNLARVRQRADRVDFLLANVTRARGRAKRAEDQSKFSAEIAYAEAARTNAARRVEFSSARERHADASLDSLEQRRVAHHASRLVSVTEEAYEVVRQVHWQLDALSKELRATIHGIQFLASLEH